MSTPFIGQISMFSFGFPPKGFAMCNGQILPIAQNQALFSLLGTTFGGNGITTFALPDLRGRTPVHAGTAFTLGQVGGQETHTLITTEMPTHNHLLSCNTDATQTTNSSPSTSVWGTPNQGAYSSTSDAVMSAGAIGAAGGSQPHENMSPFQTINFCISLNGIFPSRN